MAIQDTGQKCVKDLKAAGKIMLPKAAHSHALQQTEHQAEKD